MNKKYGIPNLCTGRLLKWIAMLTMFIDHVGYLFFPNHLIFRIIGRMAFPIYCFLLAEGAVHTRNRRDYLTRLVLFGLLSEIPFDLAFHGTFLYLGGQNVFFTLAFGLLTIVLLDGERLLDVRIAAVLLCIAGAQLLHTDYGAMGVLCILLFYRIGNAAGSGTLSAFWGKAAAIGVLSMMGGVEFFAFLSLLPIALYNGKRSLRTRSESPLEKYACYLFYPGHLLVLVLIRHLMG